MHRTGPIHAGAAALLAAAIVAQADASQLRVEIDDDSADLVTTVFERSGVNRSLLFDVLRSDGYQLVYLHAAGRSGGEPDSVRAELEEALAAAVTGVERPGFGLERVRAEPGRYRATLRDLRGVESRVRWRAVDRVKEFLPPMRSSLEATAYIVVGGDVSGMAFGDRDDIVLRLDDLVPGKDGDRLDVDRLTSVLAHELYHVAFRAAGGFPPRPESPDRAWSELSEAYGTQVVGEVWRASGERWWDGERMAARFEAWVPPAGVELLALDRYVAMLARLETEGCAVYVDAPLRDPGTTGRHSGEIERWMSTIPADFDYLARVTKRLALGASAREIEAMARAGFENDGSLYRVGFHIAKRIDVHAGRRPLIACARGGALEFFDTYFQTHPYGPGQIDSATEDEIERIIRQIRALGEFDPES